MELLLSVAWCGAIVLQPQIAAGQESEEAAEAEGEQDFDLPPDGTSSTALPPVVKRVAQPDYPPRGLAERIEATVRLQLLINADGQVTEATVVESAGEDFDAAAVRAALVSSFLPARVAGEPTSARILFDVLFQLPPWAQQTPAEDPSDEASAVVAHAKAPSQKPPNDESAAPVSPEAPEVRVVVQGLSRAERLEQSAEAVKVVELDDVKKTSVDLGEVLSRQAGVSVQREGGLGSSTRFSLAGFTDDQIRFFLDGIPLEFMGYPLGLANVPVGLVDHVEIYEGVVPIRFGADALGGAVNLTTAAPASGTHAAASYQAGSFALQRGTATVSHWHPRSGLFARAAAFGDTARNDYPVQVLVTDDDGSQTEQTVSRNHDQYRALGGSLEMGILERPWARKLILRAHVTDTRKEVPHNPVMTVAYGEVEYGRFGTGASLRYENTFGHALALEAVGGYQYLESNFLDQAACIYDWYGRCVRDRISPGEIEPGGFDQRVWDHNGFGRIHLRWRISPSHALKFSTAPTFTSREGIDDLVPAEDVDPLQTRRRILTWINGVEYETRLGNEDLENLFFGKHYFQMSESSEEVIGGGFADENRTTGRFGIGDGIRYRFLPWLYGKASYEFATRLPSAGEVFGDGVLISDNLDLKPEVSHNANLGGVIDYSQNGVGSLRTDVTGFLRRADQLIVLIGYDRNFRYENVYSARSLGVEAKIAYATPGDIVRLNGNVTYQDFVNLSSEGLFRDYRGDRIPNRPYLFGNLGMQLVWHAPTHAQDSLSVLWHSRYVHGFYRTWESTGLDEFKQDVDAQLIHNLGLLYQTTNEDTALSFSGEVQNLTDEQAFDFYGIQKPGRGFYFKMTVER